RRSSHDHEKIRLTISVSMNHYSPDRQTAARTGCGEKFPRAWVSFQRFSVRGHKQYRTVRGNLR
ncbi:MAG: hypothetical protein AABZ14_05600, partial [Candidatus Margulisiibacteriota bacterium]